jgi:hypothetical protein
MVTFCEDDMFFLLSLNNPCALLIGSSRYFSGEILQPTYTVYEKEIQ